MTERSVRHASFTIEHRYDAPPARVFAAFADPVIHDRWFVKGDGWPIAEYAHDFRVGGREHGRFSADGQAIYLNETVYLDIVPRKRIVLAYSMARGETRISASLGTVELSADGAGTRLRYTEQGAFLDVEDQPADRESGWGMLLDSLDKELRRNRPAA